MTIPLKASDRMAGNALVILQFGLILLIVLVTDLMQGLRERDLSVWISVMISAVTGVSALMANRPGNFNIHPIPKNQGRLVVHGIYRSIRHPMYTAVLAFSLAALLSAPNMTAAMAFVLLGLVLLTKALLEERWMSLHHPQYRAYMKRTTRFIPGLF
jgi:protein-S-isoprenylcysteine O-methyltransferase Ste14